jgi:hypothetical protein
VSGLADLNRKIVDATNQDLEAAFAAIDKLASSESLTDAFETYVDYLRQQSKVGVARAKDAASFVSTKASEGFDALPDGIAKFMTVRSQAAWFRQPSGVQFAEGSRERTLQFSLVTYLNDSDARILSRAFWGTRVRQVMRSKSTR